MTPYEAAIRARQRLNLPPSEIPRLLTYIDPALRSTARIVAQTRSKRKLLLTDELSVSAPIESDREVYYVDLTTLTADTLYERITVQSDVLGTSFQSETVWPDGLRVRVSYPISGAGSWTGISDDTDYWVFLYSESSPGIYNYRFATTQANAHAHIGITMATDDTGDVYVTPVSPCFQILKEYLDFGTVRQRYADLSFTDANVNGAGDSVDMNDGDVQLPTGTRIRLSDSAGVLSGVDNGEDYWIININNAAFQFAETYADALAGTFMAIGNDSIGTATLQVYDAADVQFSENPQFAGLAKPNAVSHVYGWLETDRLIIDGATAGICTFRVPFVPVLENLPERLENDFIEEMVRIAQMDLSGE